MRVLEDEDDQESEEQPSQSEGPPRSITRLVGWSGVPWWIWVTYWRVDTSLVT